MKRALFLTATDRPNYLESTLNAWKYVRGIEAWDLFLRVEPSHVQSEIVDQCEAFEHPNKVVIVNPYRYGVLHHPWVGFNELFESYDFVVRAEDDLLVSDDILEYFEYSSSAFSDHPKVSAVCAFSREVGPQEDVVLKPEFNPWVWGTWKDRWEYFMRDTWDHDYSTFNGTPGHQSGWDWNLNSRLYPQMELLSVFPVASRVQNIGIYGVHGTLENYESSPSFVRERDFVEFSLVR